MSTVAEKFLADVAVKTTVCPRCEQKPGQPCVTVKGNETNTHAPRTEGLLVAYYQGQGSTLSDPAVMARAQKAVDGLISTRNIDLEVVFEALERAGYTIVERQS